MISENPIPNGNENKFKNNNIDYNIPNGIKIKFNNNNIHSIKISDFITDSLLKYFEKELDKKGFLPKIIKKYLEFELCDFPNKNQNISKILKFIELKKNTKVKTK